MFFCWDVTVLADTKETNPDRYWLSLPRGIVTQVHIKYPAGCHGMVRVRLFQEALQLIPLSEDEWVTGDDEAVITETYAELLDKPYKLRLVICSPDTIYPHTITVRINVQPEEAAGVSALTKAVKSVFEKLGF